MVDRIETIDNSDVCQEIADALIAKGKTLAVAESCTGGNIAHSITKLAGCSEYFRGGVVSYANEAKIGLLGVKARSLEAHGAVSQMVVEQMAKGARKALGADYAIATSGVAGPGGGSVQKPVGMVWIAVSSEEKTISQRFQFFGNRLENIEKATRAALFLLKESL